MAREEVPSPYKKKLIVDIKVTLSSCQWLERLTSLFESLIVIYKQTPFLIKNQLKKPYWLSEIEMVGILAPKCPGACPWLSLSTPCMVEWEPHIWHFEGMKIEH